MKYLSHVSTGVLGAFLGVALYLLIPTLFKYTEEASADVIHDLHGLHVQIERLESTIKNDIRKDVDVLKNQIEKLLELKECNCSPSGECKCEAKVTMQWYQSQENPNVFYYGYINKDDGILYYTFWSLNGQVIKSDLNKPNKTSNFINKPMGVIPPK